MSTFEIPVSVRAALRAQHARDAARARARRSAEAAERAHRATERRALLPLAREIVSWAHAFVATGAVRTRIVVHALHLAPGAHDVVMLQPDGGLVFAHRYKWMGGGSRLARTASEVAEATAGVVRSLHAAIRSGSIWSEIATAARAGG